MTISTSIFHPSAFALHYNTFFLSHLSLLPPLCSLLTLLPPSLSIYPSPHLLLPSPLLLYPQTKNGYLQSNEEEEFLHQVADVLQKPKLEKKKPGTKLQPQEPPVTKPLPPELDHPETKVVGSSKPSDTSGHQEIKPKATETKGSDTVNPPITAKQVLKDKYTATSPHLTLDKTISHAPKEKFSLQTSFDSVSSRVKIVSNLNNIFVLFAHFTYFPLLLFLHMVPLSLIFFTLPPPHALSSPPLLPPLILLKDLQFRCKHPSIFSCILLSSSKHSIM